MEETNLFIAWQAQSLIYHLCTAGHQSAAIQAVRMTGGSLSYQVAKTLVDEVYHTRGFDCDQQGCWFRTTKGE